MGLVDFFSLPRIEGQDAYRILFEQAANGIAIVDLDGRFLKVNRECRRILGFDDDQELVSLNVRALTPPDDVPDDQQAMRDLLSGEIAHYRKEKRVVRGDGTLLWIQLDVSLARGRSGEPAYFVSQLRDIAERKAAERALHLSEVRFRTLATYAPFGVVETDPAGRCTFVNEFWTKLTGQSADEALEFGWSTVVHPDDRGPLLRAWGDAVRAGEPLSTEFRCCRTDGTVAWVLGSALPIRNELGDITAYLGNLVDVTQHKASDEKLRQLNARLETLASTDALTGLVNRRAIVERLATLWATTQRRQEPLSCVMLDIDHFKAINDALGHDAGDAVLSQVAATIKAAVRPADVCGRYGGEEFLVLCPDTTLDEAQQVAERIRQSIESRPTRFEDDVIAATVSLGVACSQSLREPDMYQLVSAADDELFRAKREGRNCTRVARDIV